MTYFILLSICMSLILTAGIIYGIVNYNETFSVSFITALIVFIIGWLLIYGLNGGSVEVETAEIVNESRTKSYVAFQLNTSTPIKHLNYRDPNKVYIYKEMKYVNNPFEVKIYHFTNLYGFHTSSEIIVEIKRQED